MTDKAQTATIETRIPGRLDRLPWSRFHWRVVVGLGCVWILDGLEATMVGSVASRLTEPGSGIDLGAGQIGLMAMGFYISAGVMALGGVAELVLGVKAEQTKLEDIAKPLTAEDAEQEEAQ